MRKINYILIVASLLFCNYNYAQQSITLSLQECRKMALENNNQSKIADKTIEKQNYVSKSLLANFFPKVSLKGLYIATTYKFDETLKDLYFPTYTPGADGQLKPNILVDANGNPITNNGVPVFKMYAGIPQLPISFTLNNSYYGGIMLEQPIFMGGKIIAANKMGKLGVDLANENKKLTDQEIIVNADQAYWTCIKTLELYKTALKYRETVNNLLTDVNNGYEADMISKADLLKVKVKVNDATLQVQRAKNGIRLAKMNLCHILGLPLASQIEFAQEDFTLTNRLQRNDDISTRPEFGMLSKQIEISSLQEKITRSDYLPSVAVGGSYGYANGAKLNDFKLLNSASFQAMLSVSIPIFHWREGANKIKSAKADTEILRYKQDQMTQLMELEAAQAYNAYDEAVLELDIMQTALDEATESLQESKNRYEAGFETLTNYLESQTVWQKSWSDLTEAKAKVKINESKYLKTIGQLNLNN